MDYYQLFSTEEYMKQVMAQSRQYCVSKGWFNKLQDLTYRNFRY